MGTYRDTLVRCLPVGAKEMRAADARSWQNLTPPATMSRALLDHARAYVVLNQAPNRSADRIAGARPLNRRTKTRRVTHKLRLKAVPARFESEGFREFADRFAVDAIAGLVVNVVWSDGELRDGGLRLWPQTERLKAEARRKNAVSDRVARALVAIGKHFEGVRPGLHNQRPAHSARAVRGHSAATIDQDLRQRLSKARWPIRDMRSPFGWVATSHSIG
jgi:hypothetical protein